VARTDELVAYLHGLPDDWGSWLVLADALCEQGDERGQLLVLEHRLATVALAPAEATELRREADAIADAWLASWGDFLRSDDAEQCAWSRRLAPLAELAHPISQLLALLEPSDDVALGLSPPLALHRDRVLAAARAWIERAFDGVPVPDAHHRTIFQAEAADGYGSCDRSRDHLGRWQDLPDEHLLVNQWAFPHFDEQGICYYLPAAMSFALRHHLIPHAGDSWLTTSLAYTIQPSKRELRAYQQGRFALLDRGQRGAIYAFARATDNITAAIAWATVFEAERGSERADWFELFSPA
jgi:hypothetical protein